MGTSNEELLKTIRYYQQSLDKYTSFENNYKLLSIIEKLKRLPIATFHLEETGIGRTVNALRKLGGDVGDAAKGLVARWKEMVVQEEVKAKENSADDTPEACASENENDSYEEKENSFRMEEKDSRYREKENSSSHKSSDTERKSSEKHEKDKKKYSSNNGSGSSHEKKDKHKNKDDTSKTRGKESDSSSDEHSSKIHHDSSGFESEDEIYEKKKHSKSTSKRKNESESSEDEEDEDKKHKSKKSKHSKNSSDSEDSTKKHKSSKSNRDYSTSKSKSSDKSENKRKYYDSSSDREVDNSKSKHRSSTKSKRDSDCEESNSRSKQKSMKSYESSSDNEEAKHKPKHDSKSRHEKESSKSKSHTSRTDKHEKKDKKESKREESKEKHSHKRDESRKQEDKNKKSKDEKENGKREKSSSSSRLEENSKRSGSGVKHKSNSEKKKDKIKVPKPANTEKIMNGIDSGSGASFAEALGMCGPMVSKSSSSSKRKSSSLPMSEKPRSSSSYVRPGKAETVEEDTVPSLLKEQPPEPLNINISSLLPEITPNYRPVGFPVDSTPKRVLSQDEALSQVISNKNMRTKVYSGNKSYGKVETLFDLCVRILQDNIDALEYTGGVPYLILKPVLEKATPDQLFNMEHHNPYLIEDTDELWLLHCQKEFRNKKREELESWREMYMRCLDEREARLNAITANIKQSQDKSTPIRTTKLAYIDSVVKPPRNVARKQAKNGISFDKKPAQTPASRVAALAGEAGKVAVPNPGSRFVERSSSSSSAAAMKPKKAPLMAKTLSFLKNRFRR